MKGRRLAAWRMLKRLVRQQLQMMLASYGIGGFYLMTAPKGQIKPPITVQGPLPYPCNPHRRGKRSKIKAIVFYRLRKPENAEPPSPALLEEAKRMTRKRPAR